MILGEDAVHEEIRLRTLLPFKAAVCFALLLASCFCPFSPKGYGQTEPAGESPVHWGVPWPQPGKAGYGYPLLPQVKSFSIYQATPLTGVYSHHAQIGHLQRTFFSSWSNQEWGEDGPGQRVLCSLSTNGEHWQPPFVCLPSMDDMRQPGHYGRVLTAEAWVIVDGKMYVVADVNDKPGPTHTIEAGYEATALGQKRRLMDGRVGWGRMARSVAPNGDIGPIFWLVDDPPAPMEGFPQYPDAQDAQFHEVANQINHYLENPLHRPGWAFLDHVEQPIAIDHHRMCEPTAFRRPDGVVVKLSRDCGPHASHRMYASLSEDGGTTWATPVPTNIPDSPSKSVAGTLPNGETYLIGNQISPNRFRDPLVMSLSPYGKTFNWAAALRHGTPPLRYPGKSKNRGFQYPAALVVGNSLWVIYSINKEDIAISRIPLSDLRSPKIK